MSTGTFLGKIVSAKFGFDSDKRFGLFVSLSFNGASGVDDFIGVPYMAPPGEIWDAETKTFNEVLQICAKANYCTVDQLVNKPIEVQINQNTLASWRILTEVL